jgi:hypothetical protein
MRTVSRLLLTASLLLVPSPPLLAQTAVDPSGHWAGAIHVPPFNGASSREIGIDVDLVKKADGALAGTFGQPAQNLKGLPLGKITVEGAAVTFELKASSGGGLFLRHLLRRVDVRRVRHHRGRLHGSLQPGTDWGREDRAGAEERGDRQGAGRHLERRARVRRQEGADRAEDGQSTGRHGRRDDSRSRRHQRRDSDRHDAEGSNVTIEIATVGGAFTAVLNDNELAGTWTQGAFSLPLTMKRGVK